MIYYDSPELSLGREVMSANRRRAMCSIRIFETGDLGRLERARVVVAKLAGVTKAEADHALQILSVEYDPGRITLDEIRGRIKRL